MSDGDAPREAHPPAPVTAPATPRVRAMASATGATAVVASEKEPPGRHAGRRPLAERLSTWLLAGPVLALLLWSVVYPNVSVVAQSFEGGLAHWRAFAASPADREALVMTLLVSIASVVAAGAIGIPLAFLLARFDFPGRRTLGVVATLPAALPPLVGVLSFYFLYSEGGLVTKAVQRLFGLDGAPWNLSGFWAIVFVHAYTMYVYVFLFVSAALERFDSSLDEAAAGLGASRARRLWRVTLPVLTPAIAGALLLVFMSSMGSFTAPHIFGSGFRVLATQIFASKTIGALELAYVETTVLAIASVIVLLVYRHFEQRRSYASLGKGAVVRVSVSNRGARWASAVAAALLVAVLVLPHLMIMLVSFAKDFAWTTQVLPPVYTTENYTRVFGESQLWRPVRNSLAMTAIATVGSVVLCFFAAYLVVLRRFRGRRLLQLLLALPWAIPATAIAFGLVATFNVHDPKTLRFLLVGTFWILPFAYIIRGIPLVAGAIEGSLRQMDPSLEDAARGLGASWPLLLRRVILPAARPGLVAGAMLVAITAVGEYVASAMLFTHASRPISMEIDNQLRLSRFGTAAAYSALLIVIVAAISALARWGERRLVRGEAVVN